jgi:hypothetical protein
MNDEFGRIWKEAIAAEFMVLSRHFFGATEENHEKSRSQDSRSPGLDLNAILPEYKAGVLTT